MVGSGLFQETVIGTLKSNQALRILQQVTPFLVDEHISVEIDQIDQISAASVSSFTKLINTFGSSSPIQVDALQVAWLGLGLASMDPSGFSFVLD